MELAALALLAADRDVAAHRVHNILGDRHPQPGTLRFLHPGVVLSAEGFKYDLLVLLRHADSRIAYQEMGADKGGRLRKRLLIHHRLNRAVFRRKFGGVAQQVDQHLVQPHAVTVHILRKNVVGGRVEPLMLCLDLGLHDIDNAVHRLSQ